MELFVQKLCGGAAAVATAKEARTLTAAHLCAPARDPLPAPQAGRCSP